MNLNPGTPNLCPLEDSSSCLQGFQAEPRLFGDYQYFLSFGGDQYLDIPLAIDAVYGTRGLIVQVGHFISQVSYEVTGYAALGIFFISQELFPFRECLRIFK